VNRIYVVTNRSSGASALIRAPNQAQAIRHAAHEQFDIEVASQDVLVSMLKAGAQVAETGRVAGEEPEPSQS
jgi:hypothetical protein